MTDSEIIEVLERWLNGFEGNAADYVILCNALSIITRQKAEIEEHQKHFEKILTEVQMAKELYVKDIAKIKSEARREFADRIQKHCTSVELNEYIDTLVEEMESESE